MLNTNTGIKDFFARYEARLNKALGDPPEIDAEATAGAFADFFVEASPLGVSGGRNDEAFLEQIPRGYEMYRSIGTKSMKIVSLQEIPIDDYHFMVKIHWQARYVKKDSSEQMLDFDVVYFVQTMNDTTKIFAYITGDEQKAYRDYGLIPG